MNLARRFWCFLAHGRYRVKRVMACSEDNFTIVHRYVHCSVCVGKAMVTVV